MIAYLNIVHCADGIYAHLGDKQAAWAVEQNLIRLASEEQTGEYTGARSYRTDLGAWALHQQIASQPDLRECDICGKRGRWEYPCREFAPDLEGLAGATIGGPHRPVYCCFMCGTWITGRRRRELVNTMLGRAARGVAALHGVDPDKVIGLSGEAAAAIKPKLQAFVGQLLEHTHGKPVRR